MKTDYIKCPICGEKRISLGKHIKYHHGMSKEEFKVNYPNFETISPSLKKERSEKVMKALDNDRVRKLHNDRLVKQWKDSEYREKITRGVAETWKDKKFREKVSKGHKENWDNEEFRNRHREATLKAVNTEEYKSKMSKTVKRLWTEKEYQRKVLEGGCKKYKKKSGEEVFFRSSWEYIVSEYLDEFGIVYEYETRIFEYVYEGTKHTYIPDFYLVDMDLYLEVKAEFGVLNPKNIVKFQSVIDSGNKILYVTDVYVKDKNKFHTLLGSKIKI
jgi:hypothetical protein